MGDSLWVPERTTPKHSQPCMCDDAATVCERRRLSSINRSNTDTHAAYTIDLQFEHLGVIVDYQHGPPGSNWVHLQYQYHLNYEAALTKNGTIFQGSMIGVIPRVWRTTQASRTHARKKLIHTSCSLMRGWMPIA